MIINQFKSSRGELVYRGLALLLRMGMLLDLEKVGEWSGLRPLEKPSATPKLIKITPPKPTTPLKDGVIEEPVKAPPQKKVWVPKPNHLNPKLDTLLDISNDPLPRAPRPSKKSLLP
jgi:hypothetical protein